MLASNLFLKLTHKVLYFSWGLVFINGCEFASTNEKDSIIRSIRISSSLPTSESEGKRIYYNDSMVIFYWKDLVMYQMPVIKSQSKIIVNASGDIISDSLVKIERRMKYVVYKKKDSIGFLYDSIDVKVGRKIFIDSFLKSNTITNFNNFYQNKKQNDSLVVTLRGKSKNLVIEKYIPKRKPDPSYSDSTILFYDKSLKGFDFSFSSMMDSIMRSKLFEIRIIYNGSSAEERKISGFRKELVFKMEEIVVNDISDIRRLFEKNIKNSLLR